MPRTDNDSWDITQSVGATALGVAAARAAETESDNPLINDPFARVFVDAAGEGMWSIYANPTLMAKAMETRTGAAGAPTVDDRLHGRPDGVVSTNSFSTRPIPVFGRW